MFEDYKYYGDTRDLQEPMDAIINYDADIITIRFKGYKKHFICDENTSKVQRTIAGLYQDDLYRDNSFKVISITFLASGDHIVTYKTIEGKYKFNIITAHMSFVIPLDDHFSEAKINNLYDFIYLIESNMKARINIGKLKLEYRPDCSSVKLSYGNIEIYVPKNCVTRIINDIDYAIKYY